MILPLLQSASDYPNHLAFLDRNHQIRYTDLDDLISTNFVSHLGNLNAGEHLAWCPKNDLESFLSFWAMQHRGLVACPISHRFPVAARNEVLERLDAIWMPKLLQSDFKALDINRSFHSNRNLTHPATILLSSGSTGIPKAVVHTLGAHLANAVGAASNMPLVPGDRWNWSLPLFHVSGLSILIRCARAGATVVGTEANSKLSAELLDEYQVTHLSVVSTQLQRLMGESGFPSRHLKAVLLGGGSIDPKLVSLARRKGVNVFTTYGLTETASQVTTSTVEDCPETSGCVLPGRQVKISNDGEILVRGETLCLGYYRDGAVVPVVDADGWFHTKDFGNFDQSKRLLVKGRMDNMFISGGENIYPENIEREMLSAFDIQEVIVVPKFDPAFGNRPVAFVSGDLPIGWETILRMTLQGYEIPVEIHAWPLKTEEDMKISRKFFQGLIRP